MVLIMHKRISDFDQSIVKDILASPSVFNSFTGILNSNSFYFPKKYYKTKWSASGFKLERITVGKNISVDKMYDAIRSFTLMEFYNMVKKHSSIVATDIYLMFTSEYEKQKKRTDDTFEMSGKGYAASLSFKRELNELIEEDEAFYELMGIKGRDLFKELGNRYFDDLHKFIIDLEDNDFYDIALYVTKFIEKYDTVSTNLNCIKNCDNYKKITSNFDINRAIYSLCYSSENLHRIIDMNVITDEAMNYVLDYTRRRVEVTDEDIQKNKVNNIFSHHAYFTFIRTPQNLFDLIHYLARNRHTFELATALVDEIASYSP